MPIRLVVGLGNPGPQYARTRHNIGFMLLDEIGPDTPWRRWRKSGLCAVKTYVDKPLEGESAGPLSRTAVVAEFFCVKPQTFMNDCGHMVRDFAAFHKIQPQEMLVCYDDVALPLGRIRLRMKGSSGGHKGMQSIVDQLGTQDIPRLRLGIGPVPPHRDAKDFVLGAFTEDERDALRLELDLAASAMYYVARYGMEYAMNTFNPAAP